MARVTGIGGVFFKAEDPKALQEWYVRHLGMAPDEDGYMVIRWGGDDRGSTVWAPFPADTDYMGPSEKSWMVNYRVDDLDGLLSRLRAEGVAVDEATIEDANGRFGWCWDLEGNKVELWEPAPGM
ncbi:MAG TPA: VOC family protein [Acidimicrobiia bacterium]